jgi:hypothetical protein
MRKVALWVLGAASVLLLVVACGPVQLDLDATATFEFVTSDAATRFYVMTETAGPTRTPVPTGEGQLVMLWCPYCAESGKGIPIYADSNTGSDVVVTLPHKTEVEVVSQMYSNGRFWYHIRHEEKAGWVWLEYIKW